MSDAPADEAEGDPAGAPLAAGAAGLLEALARRYDPRQGWVLLHEVRPTTGFAEAVRSCDAIALQTWPSRGICLVGHEVKVSRSDLVRELKDEGKAAALQRYCRQWFLVVSDAKVVSGLSIPDAWGVLAPRGRVLRAIREAPDLNPEPWPPEFVASLVRRASEDGPGVARAKRDVADGLEKAKADIARLRDQEAAVAAAVRSAARAVDSVLAGRFGRDVRHVVDIVGAALVYPKRAGWDHAVADLGRAIDAAVLGRDVRAVVHEAEQTVLAARRAVGDLGALERALERLRAAYAEAAKPQPPTSQTVPPT